MALYIGLMSGTSLDAIDIAVVDIEAGRCQLIEAGSAEIPADLRSELLELCSTRMIDPERIAVADARLGHAFATATSDFLRAHYISADGVVAIGSHGQTIRHRPPRNAQSQPGFSWQIGDPNVIAEHTAITTVADFRRRDVAAGGQGAPLVPAFHRAVFGSSGSHRAVLNIGGMANISLLGPDGSCNGFDVGPGNVLMDAWYSRHNDGHFDADGHWANSGEIDSNLLLDLLRHPFLALPPPKSTGREEFNLDWLTARIAHSAPTARPVDIQATLLEFSAVCVASAINDHAPSTEQLYICGGGAHNGALLKRMSGLLPGCRLETTSALGIAPDWVEAAAFAWLASRTLDGLSGNVPAVTGACREVPLGAIYPGSLSP